MEETTELQTQEKPKFWTKNKIIIAAVIVLVLIIAAVWIFGIFVYTSFASIGGQ